MCRLVQLNSSLTLKMTKKRVALAACQCRLITNLTPSTKVETRPSSSQKLSGLWENLCSLVITTRNSQHLLNSIKQVNQMILDKSRKCCKHQNKEKQKSKMQGSLKQKKILLICFRTTKTKVKAKKLWKRMGRAITANSENYWIKVFTAARRRNQARQPVLRIARISYKRRNLKVQRDSWLQMKTPLHENKRTRQSLRLKALIECLTKVNTRK